MIRIRTDKPSDFARLGTAIEISWPYESNTPFPKTRDNEQMLEFERALDELAGGNGYSELARVSTGNGVKEWLFYSSNQHRFMDRMNSLLKNHPVYPIEIKFYEDSSWRIWSETATALESRGGG